MRSCAMRQLAGSRWQPAMMDNPGSSALMLGAESQANGMSCAISLPAVATVSRWPQKTVASGVASRWRRNLAKLSCVGAHGIQSHTPNGRPALMKSISILTLNSEGTRKRGIEATAALSDAPACSVTSQSSADYVARDERGDPRGRNSGVGLGTANLRWPTRAEGEKRFRSATRNP
jgi:hypothetical protein